MKISASKKKPTRTAAPSKRSVRATRSKINYAQSSASSGSQSSRSSSASSYETNGKKTPSPKANDAADRLGRLNIDDSDVESLIKSVNESKNRTEILSKLSTFKKGDMYDKAEAVLKSPIWRDKLEKDTITSKEKTLLSELIHSTKGKYTPVKADQTPAIRFMETFKGTQQFSKERVGELGLQRKYMTSTGRTIFAATPGRST